MQDLTCLILDKSSYNFLSNGHLQKKKIVANYSNEILGEINGNVNGLFGEKGLLTNLVYPVDKDRELKTYINTKENSSNDLPQMFREASSKSIPIIRAESIKLLKPFGQNDSQMTEILGSVVTPATSLRGGQSTVKDFDLSNKY